ncbi:MAG: hypothetical protein M0P01_03185 [Treponema sp.]|nr:hypothetical protein [Treponema sp.]
MKRFICIVLFILISSFASAEKLTTAISTIKIFIDDTEFSWKKQSEKPQPVTGGEPAVKIETVISFTSLKPEKRMTQSALEREVHQTELRLNDSGYFYSAKADCIHSRKEPGKMIVIITVKSGFFWRFGGGNAYGVVGKSCIDGRRLQVLGYAGWNKNGASVLYEHAFDSPFITGCSLFWDGPASLVTSDGTTAGTSSVTGICTPGFFITPDIRFCTDIICRVDLSAGFIKDEFCISPYVRCSKFFSRTLTSASAAQAYFYPCIEQNMFSGTEISVSLNWTPVRYVTFAFCTAGGSSPEDNTQTFSLNWDTAYTCSNTTFEDRIIRSGYKTNELTAEDYLYASFETRWNMAGFLLPPAFSVRLQPFVFIDAALVDRTERDAFGGGLRVLFDNPVFAYFTFCCGVNHEGAGRFCFTATKGF